MWLALAEIVRPRSSFDGPTPEIDSIRGLACILLVSYHSIGIVAHGNHPSEDPLQYALDSFSWIRMPLFSALSGYLFMLHTPTRRTLAVFLIKKARRLGIPYLVVLVVFATYLESTDRLVPTILTGLAYGYHHLWFLQALVLIFFTYGLWFAAAPPRTRYLVGLIVICVLTNRLTVDSFFSADGALYLLPFFTAGMIVHRHADILGRRRPMKGAVAALLLALAIQQGGVWGVLPLRGPTSPIAIVAGICAIVAAFRWTPRMEMLVLVGTASYTIYLWHYLVLAIVRDHGITAGIDDQLIYVCCLTLGLLVPLLIHKVFAGTPYLGILLTGSGTKGGRSPGQPRILKMFTAGRP